MHPADVFNVTLIVLGVLVTIAGVWYVMRDGDRDRDEEDAARDFFEAHGHWPDETPADAAARTGAPAATPSVSVPDADGRV